MPPADGINGRHVAAVSRELITFVHCGARQLLSLRAPVSFFTPIPVTP